MSKVSDLIGALLLTMVVAHGILIAAGVMGW